VKVNLGCGRRSRVGWVNVDRVPLPGVDIVAELDDPEKVTFQWPDNTVDEFALSHVLEHLRYPLPLMAEAWRVAKPGAHMTVACPYGSSDDAWEDPTHVRAIFLNSFGFFGQPYFWRADYGYRGDWTVERLELDIPAHYRGVPNDEVLRDVMLLRNVVTQITATLRAVKPAREPRRELVTPPPVVFRLIDK
jgi:SAM-dependent methyltransferase